MKYKFNCFLLFFSLVLVIGCGTDSKTKEQPQRKIDGIDIKDILDADPLWSYVTDLSQLDGIWEGFYSELNTTLNPGIIIKYETEITQTIDASAKKMSSFIKSKMTFSGDITDEDWASMKEEGSAYGEIIIVDDVNYSITATITQDVPGRLLSDENISKMLSSTYYQINKTRDKIRYPSGGYDGEEPHIITLSKKVTQE